MEYFRTNMKIILFLLLMIFVFLNAAIEPFIIQDMRILELPHDHPMFFQMYASSIFASCIALCASSIVDFKDLKPKHYIVAMAFGAVALLPMLVLSTSANISLGVATFFTYLASVTMRNQYGNKMPIVTSTKLPDIAIDVSIVVAIVVVLFLSQPWAIIEFNFSVNDVIFWLLATSIPEEVIYRLFLFYVVVKFSEDNNPPFFITILMLVIPFSIVHVIGTSIQSGLLSSLSNLITSGFIIIATIISILALKRGLFPAILLHFLINSIRAIITVP